MNDDPLGFLAELGRPLPVGLVLYPPDRGPGSRRLLWDGGRLPGASGVSTAFVVGWPAARPTPAAPGTKDADIAWTPGLWCESDSVARPPLGLPPPTLEVSTGGRSLHCYWTFRGGSLPVETWRKWSAALAATLAERDPEYLADRTVQRPGACMRLPGTTHPGTGQTCTWRRSGPAYLDPAVLGLVEPHPTAPVLPSPGRREPRRGAHGPAAAPAGGSGPRWLSRATDDVLVDMLRAVGPVLKRGKGTYTHERWLALLALLALVGPARAASVAVAAGWHPDQVERLLAEQQRRGVVVDPGTLPNFARAAGWEWKL